MHWLELVFLSAFALSAYDIAKKHAVSGNRVFSVLAITSFAGFSAVAAVLAATGRLGAVLSITPRIFVLLFAKSLLVGTSWALAYWALKTLPVTVMAPIRATGPVWVFALSLAVFGEVPSVVQAAGFALAFAGCIMFSLAAVREGFTLRDRSIWLAIGGTLAGAVSAIYDKCLIQRLALEPEQVLFWFMGGMTVIYLAAGCIVRTLRMDSTPFAWRFTIPLTGILLAASDFLYFSAVSHPDARISVLSVLRRTSVVWTFLLGGAIFRERNLLRKGIALAVLLAGVALLSLARR